jgi:allantoate deiminase
MDTDFRKLAETVMVRCQQLAAFSETAGSICRTFLSPPMHDCHRDVAAWLHSAGAEPHVDAAGNLRALYTARESRAPRVILGSHLDTIPNAGAYDGVLGVLIAVALLEALNGVRLPFALEVVGFSEEEGVRFGVPFLGSRALVGTLEELLDLQDLRGTSVREAIERFGLSTADLSQARLAEDTLAYLEFHIEQGPVLESKGYSLAAVETIVGQTRMELTFLGRSNHAGTVPMRLRHDALAAAAEWAVEVERMARSESEMVATVGRIDARPGAVNVIAGEAVATLDVRHKSDATREHAVAKLLESAQLIATRRSLQVRSRVLLDQPAVAMDPYLVDEIEAALQRCECPPYRMSSGAGHDAMILAGKVPAAMIFLRTPGGISHDPAECVGIEDVTKAIKCGLDLLQQLANSSGFQERMSRALSGPNT